MKNLIASIKNPFLLPIRSALILALTFLSGCGHLSYYGQAINGQWKILTQRQPIQPLLKETKIPIPLKQRLTNILQIRAFASEQLHLPDNSSYTYYVDLKRPFAVWSVFATPAFSFTPKSWCFWIVGCVSYRGYFSQAAAQKLAKQLREQGYDVYVAGVAAYSTLGWFADPVFNTMLRWSKPRLAGLVFHELAHQQLYIPDDTAFNEGFAMAVEYEGVKRWLAKYGTPAEIKNYQLSQQREAQFIKLILTARRRLEHIYQNHTSPTELSAAKTAGYAQLHQDYQQLKASWGGYAGYDLWFEQDLNNAKIASIATYQDLVPHFQALLAKLDGDLTHFYHQAAQLKKLSLAERHAKLMAR
jgi:predicted aminopeptidase